MGGAPTTQATYPPSSRCRPNPPNKVQESSPLKDLLLYVWFCFCLLEEFLNGAPIPGTSWGEEENDELEKEQATDDLEGCEATTLIPKVEVLRSPPTFRRIP